MSTFTAQSYALNLRANSGFTSLLTSLWLALLTYKLFCNISAVQSYICLLKIPLSSIRLTLSEHSLAALGSLFQHFVLDLAALYRRPGDQYLTKRVIIFKMDYSLGVLGIQSHP